MKTIEIPENIETVEQLNVWLKGDETVFYRLNHKSSKSESFNFHLSRGYDGKPYDDGNVYYNRRNTDRFHKFKFKNLRRLFDADVYELV